MSHQIVRFGFAVALLSGALLPASAQDGADALAKIKQLNRITGSEAQQTALIELVKDEKAGKAVVAEAAKLAKEKPSDLTYGTSFMLGVVASNQKDYGRARDLFKLACTKALDIQSVNKCFDAYENLIDVLILDKKSGDAVKECEDFLKLGMARKSEDFRNMEILMEERLINALTANGQLDKALGRATDLLDNYTNPRFMRLKASILHEADRLEESEKLYLQALRELEKGASDIDDDESNSKKGEIARTRYILSGLYVDMNKIDKATEQLQILLKQYPDNSTYNNDLGFVLADHDMKLDEAEAMIRKAIDLQNKQNEKIKANGFSETLDPGAYLDSLGWVLYKKKKYAEAKKEMLAAVQTKEGQHVEILDHLGDVHMALAEKKEAIAAWEKALTIESESKRDKKRKVEIEAKLKKAKAD